MPGLRWKVHLAPRPGSKWTKSIRCRLWLKVDKSGCSPSGPFTALDSTPVRLSEKSDKSWPKGIRHVRPVVRDVLRRSSQNQLSNSAIHDARSQHPVPISMRWITRWSSLKKQKNNRAPWWCWWKEGRGDVQHAATFGANLSSRRGIWKPGSGTVTAVGVRALARNCRNHDPSNLRSKCRPCSLVQEPVWEQSGTYWGQEDHGCSLAKI